MSRRFQTGRGFFFLTIIDEEGLKMQSVFDDVFAASGPGNIIVPLTILDIAGTSRGADVQFQVDLKKQYYTNAQIRFKYRSAAALKFAGVPVQTALRRGADGQWREVYDQDKTFRQIGAVTSNPMWQVDPQDAQRLIKTVVTASIDSEFVPFVSSVKNRHLESHDVVLELTGISYAQDGFPRMENGILNYGPVDFELSSFDAIYIVPKGGPSGSAVFS